VKKFSNLDGICTFGSQKLDNLRDIYEKYFGLISVILMVSKVDSEQLSKVKEVCCLTSHLKYFKGHSKPCEVESPRFSLDVRV